MEVPTAPYERTYVLLDDYRAHFNSPLAPSDNACSMDQREDTKPINDQIGHL